MARRIETREQRPTIPTIVGAGITEQHYFTHLKSILGCQVKVKPRYFGQEDIYQLTKKIEDVLKEGGKVIAVFDADVALRREDEKAKLDDLKKKYEKNANVILCDSLPSIEYWFLLHFADVHRLFPNSESVTKELRKYIPNYDKTDKFLSNVSWVKAMCADNKLNIALQNAAKSTEGQSYSNIPKAFNVILPNANKE